MAAASIPDGQPIAGTKLPLSPNLICSLSRFLEVGGSLYSQGLAQVSVCGIPKHKRCGGVGSLPVPQLTPSHPAAFQSCQVLHARSVWEQPQVGEEYRKHPSGHLAMPGFCPLFALGQAQLMEAAGAVTELCSLRSAEGQPQWKRGPGPAGLSDLVAGLGAYSFCGCLSTGWPLGGAEGQGWVFRSTFASDGCGRGVGGLVIGLCSGTLFFNTSVQRVPPV